MPINRVATLCIFVTNQDRAKEFYTQALGFELRADEPLYPGAPGRWLAVAPHGAETDIILYLLDQNWEHYKGILGKSAVLILNTAAAGRGRRRAKEKLMKLALGTVSGVRDGLGLQEAESNRALAHDPRDESVPKKR